jgi:hypothetical protein
MRCVRCAARSHFSGWHSFAELRPAPCSRGFGSEWIICGRSAPHPGQGAAAGPLDPGAGVSPLDPKGFGCLRPCVV